MGRKSRADRRRERIADALDKYMLELLQKGKPVLDEHGFPKKDEDGEPIYRPLSAADLQAIRQRLKDTHAADGSDSGEGVASIIDAMRKRGHQMRLAGTDAAEAG